VGSREGGRNPRTALEITPPPEEEVTSSTPPSPLEIHPSFERRQRCRAAYWQHHRRDASRAQQQIQAAIEGHSLRNPLVVEAKAHFEGAVAMTTV
jgi:hypothetical protein